MLNAVDFAHVSPLLCNGRSCLWASMGETVSIDERADGTRDCPSYEGAPKGLRYNIDRLN